MNDIVYKEKYRFGKEYFPSKTCNESSTASSDAFNVVQIFNDKYYGIHSRCFKRPKVPMVHRAMAK